MMRFALRRPFRIWCSVAALLMLLITIAEGARGDARASLPVPRGPDRETASVQTPAGKTLAHLPLSVQATVSRLLGSHDRDYRAAAVDGGFRAQNARHALSARFSAAGVDVSSEKDRLGLALRAYGYGAALRRVPAAVVHAEANQVVYRRGTLSEWYVNGPLGLEQGFTLDAPPAGRRAGPLTLALTISGTLLPRLDAGGDGLSFVASSLRYRGLFATDARGRELPAWLALDGRTLFLHVDDRGARYPLTIDPFLQQAQLTASDGAAFDEFGGRVALSGDTALVGAVFDDVGANVDQGQHMCLRAAAASGPFKPS